MSDFAANPAGLAALFARVATKFARIVVPINAAAADRDNRRPAFYCVHSLSGAGGTDFGHLAELMPGVRFFGIQAPPAKVEEDEFGSTVHGIAGYYAELLDKYQPEGAFMLGGWSAGAIIALEIAQLLRARGRAVSLLVAIDAAPKNSAYALSRWHPLYLYEIARNLPSWILRDAVTMKRSVRSLLWRVVIKAAAQAKAALDGRSAREKMDFHALEEFMDMSDFRPHERAFMERLYAAVLAYRPGKYAGPVVAYEATTKPLLDLPQVGRVWTRLAPQSTIVPVQGTHLSILRPGDVDVLAADLRQRIADASEPAAGVTAQPAPVQPDARGRKFA